MNKTTFFIALCLSFPSMHYELLDFDNQQAASPKKTTKSQKKSKHIVMLSKEEKPNTTPSNFERFIRSIPSIVIGFFSVLFSYFLDPSNYEDGPDNIGLLIPMFSLSYLSFMYLAFTFISRNEPEKFILTKAYFKRCFITAFIPITIAWSISVWQKYCIPHQNLFYTKLAITSFVTWLVLDRKWPYYMIKSSWTNFLNSLRKQPIKTVINYLLDENHL